MTGSRRRSLLPALLLTVTLLGAALPGVARAQDVPRPHLPDDADPNDWEAYYDLGTHDLKRADHARDAFIWASRLDPTRAEPMYGRWITFWLRDLHRFERFLQDDERVHRDPEVLAADSLRVRALELNPFVHRGLLVYLYDQRPGRWGDGALARGWVAYAEGRLQLALTDFGEVVRRNPEKYGHLRFERASAFVNLARYDSAATELDSLLAQLRAHDDRALVSEYESKEVLEYARGLLHLQGGRMLDARDAFARALVENPAFAPAHARLGDIAIAASDTANGLLEYAQAVEIAPADPLLHLGYGRALSKARRPADAVPQFRRAAELAPWYAEPYALMVNALLATGDRAGARRACVDFLSRAPRKDSRIAVIQRVLDGIPEGAP